MQVSHPANIGRYGPPETSEIDSFGITQTTYTSLAGTKLIVYSRGGTIHRHGGPAIVSIKNCKSDHDVLKVTRQCMQDGLHHGEDGPAVCFCGYPDKDQYWLKGVEYSAEAFLDVMHCKRFEKTNKDVYNLMP
jgi:hypothetical protein